MHRVSASSTSGIHAGTEYGDDITNDDRTSTAPCRARTVAASKGGGFTPPRRCRRCWRKISLLLRTLASISERMSLSCDTSASRMRITSVCAAASLTSSWSSFVRLSTMDRIFASTFWSTANIRVKLITCKNGNTAPRTRQRGDAAVFSHTATTSSTIATGSFACAASDSASRACDIRSGSESSRFANIAGSTVDMYRLNTLVSPFQCTMEIHRDSVSPSRDRAFFVSSPVSSSPSCSRSNVASLDDTVRTFSK
mmetsp:Transcript_22452/g.55623  ORF Transcript_22452/g.55623 Transcript_22452/m.55623 type:complete len:254 (+) Transcript_22452:950-1711(+)